MLVMARLVGGIRLSMAQATPPPSTGRRRVAGSRPPWRGPRGGCPGPGSCGEGRSRPGAPGLTAQAQIRPPICLLSGQESRRRGDRPVILSSAHGPTADSGPIANPASGVARTAQDHNPRWDHPGGLYMPVLWKMDGDILVLDLLAVAGLAGTAAETCGAIAAAPALRATNFAAGTLARRTRFCWIGAARAVPDPKTETNAAPAIPRRMCPNACRRGIGLARVRAMSSNSLFSFMPLPPLLRFSLPPSPRGRAPGSRRLPARRPS